MPRAHRYFLPGHVWHITHRCHEKAFLLKFARDRQRYLRWLFEAKKRFGLCVLDYMITSNHVHLLVKDTGPGVIAHSMQLIAGRTAQEFNLRKARQGAFWEDRYHATAVQSDAHLKRCIVYIDLNMVRAGAVGHPRDWPHSGYCEIQNPPQRYAIIQLTELSALCGLASITQFQHAHREWVQAALAAGSRRDRHWSEALAVGSETFVERIKNELGISALHRHAEANGAVHVLSEPTAAYRPIFEGENSVLSLKNEGF